MVLFYEDQLFATRANVHDVAIYPNEFVDFSERRGRADRSQRRMRRGGA